jgi:hypothetical protein
VQHFLTSCVTGKQRVSGRAQDKER